MMGDGGWDSSAVDSHDNGLFVTMDRLLHGWKA